MLSGEIALKNNHYYYYVVDDNKLVELRLDILSHLTFLSQSFNNYSPEEKFEPVKKCLWIKNPFAFQSPESMKMRDF